MPSESQDTLLLLHIIVAASQSLAAFSALGTLSVIPRSGSSKGYRGILHPQIDHTIAISGFSI